MSPCPRPLFRTLRLGLVSTCSLATAAATGDELKQTLARLEHGAGYAWKVANVQRGPKPLPTTKPGDVEFFANDIAGIEAGGHGRGTVFATPRNRVSHFTSSISSPPMRGWVSADGWSVVEVGPDKEHRVVGVRSPVGAMALQLPDGRRMRVHTRDDLAPLAKSRQTLRWIAFASFTMNALLHSPAGALERRLGNELVAAQRTDGTWSGTLQRTNPIPEVFPGLGWRGALTAPATPDATGTWRIFFAEHLDQNGAVTAMAPLETHITLAPLPPTGAPLPDGVRALLEKS